MSEKILSGFIKCALLAPDIISRIKSEATSGLVSVVMCSLCCNLCRASHLGMLEISGLYF